MNAPILALLLIAMLTGCGRKEEIRKEEKRKEKKMSTSNIPFNWTASDPVPTTQIYSDPPKSSDSSRTNFYGSTDDDVPGYRIYSIPAGTPVEEVVRYFEVGSHYGGDTAETVALVAAKASKIAEIIPCHVVFADAAGLKLRFDRQVTDEDLTKIEALFPGEEMMQAGLERYLSESDGEGSIFDLVKQENLFHFWWD